MNVFQVLDCKCDMTGDEDTAGHGNFGNFGDLNFPKSEQERLISQTSELIRITKCNKLVVNLGKMHHFRMINFTSVCYWRFRYPWCNSQQNVVWQGGHNVWGYQGFGVDQPGYWTLSYRSKQKSQCDEFDI